ncbi:hypothetical protein evm_002205 [Chilo suppressalis]|nr:hypothetical protein evm_002205 [Chilo suppressalis]
MVKEPMILYSLKLLVLKGKVESLIQKNKYVSAQISNRFDVSVPTQPNINQLKVLGKILPNVWYTWCTWLHRLHSNCNSTICNSKVF